MQKVLKPYDPKPRYIPKNAKHEQSLQRQVCTYLRMQYPQVLFRSDFSSGLRLKPYQAKLHASMQSGRAWPDLFLYYPQKVDGKQYAGMALELKKEGTKIRVTRGDRKGKLVADIHIQEQYYMLQSLEKLGYFADFGIGIDDCINKIDYYMGKPENIGLAF